MMSDESTSDRRDNYWLILSSLFVGLMLVLSLRLIWVADDPLLAVRQWLVALSAGLGLVVATTSAWAFLYPRGVPRGFEMNPYLLIGIAIIIAALLIVDQLGGLFFHGFLAGSGARAGWVFHRDTNPSNGL
jgi:hypothetical protein